MDRYEIRVVGQLEGRRARALGCAGCRWLDDGGSVLELDAPDQAALHGVLSRIRDAGLELIAVERIDHGPDEASR